MGKTNRLHQLQKLALTCMLIMSLPTMPLLTQAAEINFDQSISNYTIEKSDKSPAADAFRAGISELLNNKTDAAKAAFQKALEQDSKYVPALIGLADIAQRQNQQGDVDKYLTRAAELEPQSANVYMAWARVYQQRKRFTEAEAAFRSAASILPKASAPQIGLGELYLQWPDRQQQAVNSFQKALSLDPDNKTAQYLLGMATAATGKQQEALKIFEKSHQQNPKDPAPLIAMGRLHLEMHAPDKALAAFDEGLKSQPQYVPLLLNKSDALAQMGRWDDALAPLDAAEKLAPKSGEILLKKGDILQVTKQWDASITAYKKSLALTPDQPITYNNLALAQQGSGKQLDKAKEYAQKAVDLSPKSAPFWDTLGWIQRSVNDLNGARESLKKAIALESNVAVFHYHLGVVLADQKDKAEAIKSIQAALKLDPQFEDNQQARLKLKELGA